MQRLLFLSASLLMFLSCQQEKPADSGPADAAVHILSTPCQEGGEPNLYVSAEGTPFLSWVEYVNDTTDALCFSRLEGGQWLPSKEIARGSNWFVNWADFPSLSGFGNGEKELAAHWLAMSGKGTYDYDVNIAVSMDSGQSWAQPFVPHQDGVQAEHGFVTLLPYGGRRMFAVWLDGRHTKTPVSTGHGPMSLRAGFFSVTGDMLEGQEVDDRVCDCCQTDAVAVPGGIIVAYRDRSEDEIRDIAVARWLDGQWQPPSKVHNDNWKITGCPVNGPALASKGAQVALTWYTAAQDTPRVMLAISHDSGAQFGAPVRLDGGNPIGRVDASWVDDQRLAVSWMEDAGDEAETRIAILNNRGFFEQPPLVLTRNNKTRSSGFPIIESMGENQLLAAWTQADSARTTVKTAVINLN